MSSDYIHISDNDGFHDLNNQLKKTSNMFSMIKNNDTSNKTFTLEVYDGLDAIKMSYDALSEAVT